MTTTIRASASPPMRTVRVWFGSHPIVDYTAPTAAAARFELAMRRRFVSLQVTNEPAGASSSTRARTQFDGGGVQ